MRTSPETTKIFPALSKAQGEMTDPPKDADNDFFHSSYLTLTAMHKMSRPVLAANGLAVIQSYTEHGLETLLAHSSGEWILLDPLPLKAEKVTAQGIGSAITYSMRYALGGLCQVAGDDDDGNAAGEKRSEPLNIPVPQPAKPMSDRTPGGASVKSLGLARGLFVTRTTTAGPKKDETEEEQTSRRESNCFAISDWLNDRKFEMTSHDDELVHMPQEKLSKVIDLLKVEIEGMTE